MPQAAEVRPGVCNRPRRNLQQFNLPHCRRPRHGGACGFALLPPAVRQASDSRIEVLRSADLLPPAGLRDFGADAERPEIAGRAYSRAHTEYSHTAHTEYSAEPTLSTQPSPH